MWNVFAALINEQGEIEEFNLGSLYVKFDDRGYIVDIEIEPYDTEDLEQYESYFDGFDSETPEIPRRVHLGLREASIEGFFQAEGCEVDFEEFEDHQDQAFLSEACEQYESILKSAYRLYERAVREEPAFVGYTDIQRHGNLSLDEVLDVSPPLQRLPMQRRVEATRDRRRKKASEAGQSLCRVKLELESEAPTGFPCEIILHLGLRPDGFPHRHSPISGLADAERPLVIMENGDVRLGDAEGFFTNLMATKVAVGQMVIIWMDRCRSSERFRIVQVESFLVTETATG